MVETELSAEPAQDKTSGRGWVHWGLAVAVMAVATLFAVWSPRWNLTHFAAGLFRVSVARSVVRLHNRPLPDLLYYKDGIATTVSVERWGKTIALKNNGKVDASNSDDMGTQIMVGLMPLLWHPTALLSHHGWRSLATAQG